MKAKRPVKCFGTDMYYVVHLCRMQVTMFYKVVIIK
jgi:hypothetical protein